MRYLFIFFINFVIVKCDDWIFCNHEVREIGDACITATTNESGICKLPNECQSVFRNKNQKPSICGFAGITPIVCCPDEAEMNILKDGDSCSIKGIDGICKPADSCNPMTGISSQQFYVCSNVKNMLLVCCPIIKQPVSHVYTDGITNEQQVKPEDNKIVGNSCIVNTTSENGTCKLVDDCELLVDAKSNLCDASKVCCPIKKQVFVERVEMEEDPQVLQDYLNSLTNITIPANEYIRLAIECVVKKTGEPGVHRILEHCPALQREVANGMEIPIICEEEFCRDLVCCPKEKGTNRKRETCEQFDDPFEIIYKRLKFENYSCITKDTKKPGTIIDDFVCSSYDSNNTANNPRLCPFTFCRYKTCCEKPANPEVCMYENPKYETVRMVGSSCTDKQTGLSGTCRIIHQCQEVLNREEANRTVCGYDCCTPVVCCPERIDGTSVKMCSAYGEAVYTRQEEFKSLSPTVDDTKECSETYDAAASHGVPAKSREFPHMAALGYQIAEEPIVWQCGGTLISENFVMTAGHCLRSSEFGPVKYVFLGVLDLKSTDQFTDDCPEEFQVTEIIPHPKYTIASRYNDIGLLRLNRNVKFNPYIRPACLPTDSNIPEDLTAMGWGATGFAAPASDVLIKVTLTYYNHTECAQVYNKGETRRLSLGIMEQTQMCAGSRDDGQDTCVGDSGGPIEAFHVNLRGMATVYGITSFGRACGFVNSPAVYTKVFPYVEWIESVVWPAE